MSRTFFTIRSEPSESSRSFTISKDDVELDGLDPTGQYAELVDDDANRNGSWYGTNEAEFVEWIDSLRAERKEEVEP